MNEPSWLIIALLVFASALVSWLLTRVVRNHAIARSILDMPNDRSLHRSPTPRGGGLAIVMVVLGFLVVTGIIHVLPRNVVIGMGGGGAAVAAIGWLDDVSSVSALRRLFVHFVAAIWAVAWLGGFGFLMIGEHRFELGIAGGAAAVLAIVWATNLFNFMDGSDGIVAVEAISVGAIGGSLLLLSGSAGLGTLALVIAGATLGFAWWNWAPAMIFLGDVGSGFIGFMISALALASENAHSIPVAVWALLSCVFLVDATITLIRRLRMGHWREPHRTHAYQVAIQGGWSHKAVASWVAALNVGLGIVASAAVIGRAPLGLSLGMAALVCALLYAFVVARYAHNPAPEAER